MRKALYITGLILAVLTAQPAFAVEPTVGCVTSYMGVAEFDRPDQATASASVGLGVQAGDRIQTGSPGRAKILFDGDIVLTLGDKASVVIESFRYDTREKTRELAVRLENGRVWMLVAGKSQFTTEVKVITKTAIAAVTGTKLIVEYLPEEGKTNVLNLSGRVSVTSTDPKHRGVFQLADREIMQVRAGSHPSPARETTPEQLVQYLASTALAETADLASMPGRKNNIIDNPLARTKTHLLIGTPFGAAVDAQAEGEGGALFDAYSVPGTEDRISDTDLPLPGDILDGVGGIIVTGDGNNHRPADVTVTIDLQDNEDQNDEK
jgi:FecR protein